MNLVFIFYDVIYGQSADWNFALMDKVSRLSSFPSLILAIKHCYSETCQVDHLHKVTPTDVDHISVEPAKSYIVCLYDHLRNFSTFICWIPVYVSHAKWNRSTVYTCLY